MLFYRSLGLPLKEIRELVVEAATPEQITRRPDKAKGDVLRQLNEIQSYICLIDATIAGVRSGGGFPSEKLIRLITGLNRNAVFEYRHVRFSEQTKELLTEEYGDGESALAVYWQWKAAVLECGLSSWAAWSLGARPGNNSPESGWR